jgi:hypothetical protein
MPSNSDIPRSPFFQRNYGGFTQQQKDFFESILNPCEGMCVLDPMGGQGYYLSEIVKEQATVWLGDLNPAPLLLACLRDPGMIIMRDSILEYMNNILKYFSSQNDRENIRYKYMDDWIAPPIKQDIEKYAEIIGTTEFGNFSQNDKFWFSDPLIRFATCLPVLAAREIISFHESDNKTWLMPGGLLRETGIYGPLKRALDYWYDYANNVGNQMVKKLGRVTYGSLNVAYMDVEQGYFSHSPTPDAIITSPPYANRLDYTRMWYPELVIASILFNFDISLIKARQIGSTVVSNKPILEQELILLPKEIQKSLAEIRKDKSSRASESYYYPFFCNYAISLRKALSNMAIKLKNEGTLILYIRDTVRKDILFPAGMFVERILEDFGFTSIDNNNKKHIIRSHIGILRLRGSKPSVYGMAQIEWWLAFRKGKSYESPS